MKVGIIGLGAMGRAMGEMIGKEHELILYSRQQDALDHFAQKVEGKLCSQLDELIDCAEVILLAVKPKDLGKVAGDLNPLLNNKKLIISILGGVSLETLNTSFSRAISFRVMPNLPLIVQKGVIGVVNEEGVDQSHKKKINSVLQGLGAIYWIDEAHMSAFTALTGSNPALIYVVIEAMVEAGIAMGLRADTAQDFVLKTIEGSIELLKRPDATTQRLRHQISSPGGATIVGIQELERHRVRYAFMRALEKIGELQ